MMKDFFFKTHDEKFSMKLTSMLQFKYNYGDANREEDNSSFSLRRARLTFNGNAYGEHMQYYGDLELRSTGSKDGSKSVELLDLFGTYEKYEHAKIRFGQWKVPFNGQFMTSEAELQMIDRSEADEVFNLGRQIGVMVFGSIWEEKLEYFLGFWNGNFRNEKENDNNEHLWVARLMYDPLGHFGEAESDYEYHNKPLIHFEAAVAFDGEDDITLELDEIGELEVGDIDKTQIVGEFGLKYKGFFLISEYYWRKRHLGSFHGLELDDKNIIDQGFFVQAGYFLIPKKLEVTGRYSMVSFDDTMEEDSIIESTFGLNYFFSGRRHKLQFNAIRLDEESHEDGHDAIDYNYRLQYQVKF